MVRKLLSSREHASFHPLGFSLKKGGLVRCKLNGNNQNLQVMYLLFLRWSSFRYNVYNSQKSDVMSDLALANVEALASGEIDVNTSYGYGLRDCKDSDGNLTGKRCELTHPYDTCNNKLTWGNCR